MGNKKTDKVTVKVMKQVKSNLQWFQLTMKHTGKTTKVWLNLIDKITNESLSFGDWVITLGLMIMYGYWLDLIKKQIRSL